MALIDVSELVDRINGQTRILANVSHAILSVIHALVHRQIIVSLVQRDSFMNIIVWTIVQIDFMRIMILRNVFRVLKIVRHAMEQQQNALNALKILS